jgi:hypothetical protein
VYHITLNICFLSFVLTIFKKSNFLFKILKYYDLGGGSVDPSRIRELPLIGGAQGVPEGRAWAR